MTASIDTAIARGEHQSKHGPRFRPRECQMRTRLLFDVPSDGTATAAADWAKSRHKNRVEGPNEHAWIMAIPRGAILSWTGGSNGEGHRALAVGGGKCLSVDILREGYFDVVPIEFIAHTWTSLRFAGWTPDIDGVMVFAPEKASEQKHPLVAAVVHAKPGPERHAAMEVLAERGAPTAKTLAAHWLAADKVKRDAMASLIKVVAP